MVRFGAKKEEFIPPFLFYIHFSPKKKRTLGPLHFFKNERNVLQLSRI